MPDIRDKPLRYRELLSILQKFGVQEKVKKGSRRMLFHPNIDDKPAFMPIHPHNKNHEFSRNVIRAVRERFGITIEDFYSKL